MRIVRCPICTKDAEAGGSHSCEPTQIWRQTFQQIDQLQARVEELEKSVLYHAEDADKHRNRAIELTAALGKVWDALTDEDRRGALTDTLWMPDSNCTIFEFIDQTLNP